MLVGLVALVAGYIELAPSDSVDGLFASRDIAPGEVLDESNTEIRRVPSGLIDTASIGDTIYEPVAADDPVLATYAGDPGAFVPAGWWVIPVVLPEGAAVGDSVRLVVLDDGLHVEGVVTHPGSDDPFAAADGGVAVPPDSASDIAIAAAQSRLAVLLSTG